jgi:UDP-glucose 4-epimerase
MSDWSSQSVLITGGLGFIGSNLAHRLVSQGADVTLYDCSLPGHGSNPANVEGIRDEVTIVEADVRDASNLIPQVKDSDVIYHCAAQNNRTNARNDPHMDMEINCGGMINVLEGAKSAETSPHVVFVSTLAVIGKAESVPVTEATKSNPVGVYGANKRAAEQYCQIYNLVDGIPTTVCRPANVYGPRAPVDVGYGIQTTFIATALRDELVTVFEPGDIERDFIHIDDVVSALISVANDDRAVGETYLIGGGQGTSLKEFADTVVDIAGSGEVGLVPWPDDWDSIKRGSVYTDPSKLQAEFGWEPTVGLSRGLEETISFYRTHDEQYM